MPSPDQAIQDSVTARTVLNPNGRIVIPVAVREELGLEPGDTLLMDVEDGVLRIEAYSARIRRIQREFASLKPRDVSLVDELIAERRQEAIFELEDFQRARELRRIRDGYQAPSSKPQAVLKEDSLA